MDYIGFLIFLGIIAAAFYLGKSHFRSGFDEDIEAHLTFKAQNLGLRDFGKYKIYIDSGIIHADFRLKMNFPHKFEFHIFNIPVDDNPLERVLVGDPEFDNEISVYSNDPAIAYSFLNESTRFDLLQLGSCTVFGFTTRHIEIQGENKEIFAHGLTSLHSLLQGWTKQGSIKESLLNSMKKDSLKSMRENCAYHLKHTFLTTGDE